VPTRDHFLFTGNLITVGIDEGVVVAHQRGEALNVLRVDAVDECESGLFVRHDSISN
jgi:hypothetical protein